MAKEANFAFSGDFEDDEPETMQCDCCGEMKPVDEVTFHGAYDRGNCAGCDTWQCQDCSDRAYREMTGAPTEAEIEASRTKFAKALGPEVIAEWDKENLKRPMPKVAPEELPDCDCCRRQFGSPPEDHNIEAYAGTKVYTCDVCIEIEIQENWKYRP